jgi:hypothetical protein
LGVRAWIAAASITACCGGVTGPTALLAQTTATPPATAPPAGRTPPATSPAVDPASLDPNAFTVTSDFVSSWQDGPVTVMAVTSGAAGGPVVIHSDGTTLRADGVVLWLEPVEGAPTAQRIGIALVGNAQIESVDTGATRSADRLYATTLARGTIRFEARQRIARDASTTDLFLAALALRAGEAAGAPDLSPVTQPTAGSTQPAVPVRQPRDPLAEVPTGTSARFASSNPHSIDYNGKVAWVLPNASLFHRWPDGAYAEFYAENAMVFTSLPTRDPNSRNLSASEGSVESVYLEGDVRVIYMPADTTKFGEQRMGGRSAYFRMSDRTAVLTQAVLHTTDVNTGIPFVVRAQTIKRLSETEFEARKVTLTTSQFERPTFNIQASRIYVHVPGGDRPTAFKASNTLFKVAGVPLFWLPYAAGTTTGRGAPIRDISIERRGDFGLGVKTTWGLFETVGLEQPPGLDAEYRVDYFTDRGPAGGVTAEYKGGVVTENRKEPVDFEGKIDSYFVYEHGEDALGSSRTPVDPGYKEIRGIAGIQHQHYFPEGWQLQAQTWYLSDATFMEEWPPYNESFYTEEPRQTSLYLKRQKENRAFTFLVSGQPNSFVTTANLQQEQFEVERLPEIGYHRIGDGLGSVATFYSDNTVAGLNYRESEATLAEQGFTNIANSTPGIPALGITGVTDEVVYRGDFRQELQFPFSIGPVRAVPYVIGRYTPYSEGVDGSMKNRLLGGAGARFNTSFWRVDDTAHSELFDIHRMRHVIQPEVHAFAGVQTVERDEVFVFDAPVDDVSDLSVLQLALRQRWQTKRGGPGRWRSSDVFTLNAEGSFFRNRPPVAPAFSGLEDFQVPPEDFRGVFFSSIPEASIPRNTLSLDGAWRLSDSAVVLGDAHYNLDEGTLATASVGFSAGRGDRLGYYAGVRYIEPFESNIVTLAIDYQITPKYFVSAQQSYDLGQFDENVVSRFAISRKFDKFYLQVVATVDRRREENSISVNFFPEGVPISSETFDRWLPGR